MGDLHVVVEPVTVHVDAELGQPPLRGRVSAGVALMGRRRWRSSRRPADPATGRTAAAAPWPRRARAAACRSATGRRSAGDRRPRRPTRRSPSASPASTARSISRSSRSIVPSSAGLTGRGSPKRGPTWARSAPAMNATRRPEPRQLGQRVEEASAPAGRRPGPGRARRASCAKLVSTGTIANVAPAAVEIAQEHRLELDRVLVAVRQLRAEAVLARPRRQRVDDVAIHAGRSQRRRRSPCA